MYSRLLLHEFGTWVSGKWLLWNIRFGIFMAVLILVASIHRLARQLYVKFGWQSTAESRTYVVLQMSFTKHAIYVS